MNSIQKKILVLALSVLLIMAASWVSLIYYNQKMQNQYNDILERYLIMNEVTSTSQKIVTALNNYLLIPSPENISVIDQHKLEMEKMKEEVVDFKNVENELAITNYVHLIDSLVEMIDRSLFFHSEADTYNSNQAFTEATHISNYISEMTLTLIDTEIKTYDRFYRGIILQSEGLKQLGIWLLLLISVFLMLFTYWFSRRITKPVEKLTKAASEISKGRFDLEIEVESNDEISFLAKTLERMRVNINNLILEIQQKAQLEKELQQSKLLLKESQLRSLQSQINPHFLFNTLNTLSKKAYMEGSEETSDLLVSVAGLLRYNLKHLDKTMTLYDEVRVIQQYIDIQKARYTDRLTFHPVIDAACLDIEIPGLTLQPIVENAVIYGIEPHEDGGVIWFRIKDDGDRVTIEVEDDGPGMSEEKIKQIMEEQLDTAEGHSTGIGLSNVVKRLRLFNGREDTMRIESNKGNGTKVIIHILKERGVNSYDENINRG
ncbi:sensor histidine kinase YesM [Bacillus mesophilus]|uniref:histidine kinase n=1 Tax=Bacillus mesophilus TaxID=1808955 RepID=A0A6M0Q7Y2_9BACI|nr:sensor histidine kinase [Bacillus mesophilus]MBM7661776.1 sensor histidine kinase YesM [Bacillus mesophilus]NEY72434.1 sensor histidine kinase [Bacillus mesophilus]